MTIPSTKIRYFDGKRSWQNVPTPLGRYPLLLVHVWHRRLPRNMPKEGENETISPPFKEPSSTGGAKKSAVCVGDLDNTHPRRGADILGDGEVVEDDSSPQQQRRLFQSSSRRKPTKRDDHPSDTPFEGQQTELDPLLSSFVVVSTGKKAATVDPPCPGSV